MSDSLPLFPLPTVLFPGQVLPLYVFEEKYCALLKQVQDTRQPFGVVCIERSSRECDLPLHERISPVGTYAHLLQAVPHEDGSSSIVVAGGERFRIKQFDFSQPYLSAKLESWPLWCPTEDDALTDLRAQQLLAALQRAWPERAASIHHSAPLEPLLLGSYAAEILLSLRGEEARMECNAALYEPTLVGRIERLMKALPQPFSTLN